MGNLPLGFGTIRRVESNVLRDVTHLFRYSIPGGVVEFASHGLLLELC